MKISDSLSQYTEICKNAIRKSTAKLNKSFETTVIETIFLFFIISKRVNFSTLAKYGGKIEQTYRNTFKKNFDWFGFNLAIANQVLDNNTRNAIAIDPSFLPKSGKITPWIGSFWSGCAAQMKRGLEILVISLISIDKHDSFVLKAAQTPDTTTLDGYGSNLIGWYLGVIKLYKERLLEVSKYIVADAFFSKETFVRGLSELGFHLISRLRDDAHLQYLTTQKPTGKRGRPKEVDAKIDFKNLDLSRFEIIDIYPKEGKLYTAIVKAKALKRKIRLVIWIDNKGKHKLYFSTDIELSGKDVIEYYRTRFQIEFNIRNAKQFTGLTNCQARDIRKLDFSFNASFAAINVAKVMIYKNQNSMSISQLKTLMNSAYIIQRFFCASGFKPNKHLNKTQIKDLFDFVGITA